MAIPLRGEYAVLLEFTRHLRAFYMCRKHPRHVMHIRTWPPTERGRTDFCVLYAKDGASIWRPSMWGSEAYDCHRASLTGSMALVDLSKVCWFDDGRQANKDENDILPAGVTVDNAMEYFLQGASEFILSELKGKYGPHVRMRDIEWGFLLSSSWNETKKQRWSDIAWEGGMTREDFPPLHFFTPMEAAVAHVLHTNTIKVSPRDRILVLRLPWDNIRAAVVEFGGEKELKEIAMSSRVNVWVDEALTDGFIRLAREKGLKVVPNSKIDKRLRSSIQRLKQSFVGAGNGKASLKVTRWISMRSKHALELTEAEVLAVFDPQVDMILDLASEQLSCSGPCKALFAFDGISEYPYLLRRLRERFLPEVDIVEVREKVDRVEGALYHILQTGDLMGGEEGEEHKSGNITANIWLLKEEDIVSATKNFSRDKIIGVGHYGEVFKGHLFGSDRAVKRLLPGRAANEFAREVAVLHKLRHENVVSLIGYEPHKFWLVTEYVSGGSLKSYISEKRGVLTWHDRVRICKEMVRGVWYIHERGLVHLDLKPANVLLDEHKTSKICDMGLAKACRGEWTKAAGWVGTNGYMDPILIRNLEVGRQSDVYALGLIILQLWTGIESIKDFHGLLSSYEKSGNYTSSQKPQDLSPEITTETLVTETGSSYDDSSGLSSSGTGCTFPDSRWGEDDDDLNKLIGRFRLHLVWRSAAMPTETLEETLRCVLRCVERTWDLRPTVQELLSALEELESVARRGDDAVPLWTPPDCLPPLDWQGALQLAQREREVENAMPVLEEECSKLEGKLMDLCALRRDLLRESSRLQEEAKSYDLKLDKININISAATRARKYKEADILVSEADGLLENLTKLGEEEKKLRVKVADLNSRVARQEDSAREKKRKMAVKKSEAVRVRRERLRMERAAARRGEIAAVGRGDAEEAAEFHEEVKTLDTEISILQNEDPVDSQKVHL